jgi:pimeloyl-ACP methyl ester carboxylesterase
MPPAVCRRTPARWSLGGNALNYELCSPDSEDTVQALTMTPWIVTTIALALPLASSCQRKEQGESIARQQPASEASSPPPASATPTKPAQAGFLELSGVKLWHEVYGEGEPLIVLHGGLMGIPQMMPWIEPLAKHRKVIGVELEGHGRSPDTDRPLELTTMGDDVAAVIDKLGLDKAAVLGWSFGADAALRAAIQHPDKVQRLIVVSTAFAKNGWYPETQQGMASVGAAMAEKVPTYELSRQWPDPTRFPKFLDKMGKMMGEDYDWSDEIKKLPMPVMLVFADHDSVSQKHIAEFFALLGGGMTEPGWENTKFTNARLAVVPGYSHYNFITSSEVPPLVVKFLKDPMKGVTDRESASLTEAQKRKR